MIKTIFVIALAGSASFAAEDRWEAATFEDESVVEYAAGESDFHSIHKLQVNLSAWAGVAITGPMLSWYQPEMFKVAAGTNLVDFSYLPFHSTVDDSIGVTVKSGYHLVYHVDIPIRKGFEHGPHLAVNFGESSAKGVAEYAAGYTFMWTKFAEWKCKAGQQISARKGASQNAIHLDALAFPVEGSSTKMSSYGARLYVDGTNSAMGSDRFGFHYMLGAAYGERYRLSCMVGFGLTWGFF